MDLDQFVADVMTEMRTHGVVDTRFDAERFVVSYRRPGSAEPDNWVELANLRVECERDPERRTERIHRFVGSVLGAPTPPSGWAQARPLLRPVLRNAMFGGAQAVRFGLLHRPALPYLDEFVVLDSPTAISYVNREQVASWGVSEDEVYAVARDNLPHRSRRREPGSGGPTIVNFVEGGDSYWSSHLLVDGWLAAFAAEFGAPPVAFAAEVDGLTIVPAEPGLVASMTDLAFDEFQDATKPLSPVPYTVSPDGRLVPYAAPPDHPAADRIGRAERLLASITYDQQRAAFGGDLAALALFERDDDSMVTLARWEVGGPTLLPLADAVEVADVVVPWSVVVDLGLVEEAVEYRPARFRVPATLSPDVLTALRSRAATRD